MSKILGIDFGTTNSCVAVIEDGKEKVIINSEGGRTTPSVISVANGKFLIGQEAKNIEYQFPGSSVSSVKKYLGTNKKFQVGDQELDAVTITALILEKLKNDAETFLGEAPTGAIITVPAFFDEMQRQSLLNAARMIDLNVFRLLNEPSAAALAYGVTKDYENANVLVFDFGGGTLDVSIIKIQNNEIDVLSTSGKDIGGNDIDAALAEVLINEFYSTYNENLKENPKSYSMILKACEEAKVALTTRDDYQISLSNVSENYPDATIEHLITKKDFEELLRFELKGIKQPINRALKDAKLTTEEIDEVLLVGGSTRIPVVQKMVEEILGKKPKRTINPDECVAVGAAYLGDIISGDSEIDFTDITSLSLSLMSSSGLVNVLIPRNTKIPCSVTKTFTTSYDYQTDVFIDVFQGEREFASDNKRIGNRLTLYGITPAKVGLISIDVTFAIDESGILTVTAEEVGTENRKSISVNDYYKLSASEIENSLRIANYFKEQDAERKQILEERQSAKLLKDSLEIILNSALNLNSEEIEQIKAFIDVENNFLKNKNPSIVDVTEFANKNIAIKVMVKDYQNKILEMFDSEEEYEE